MDTTSLNKIYYDPSHPASFSTKNALWEALGRKFSKNDIQKWLDAQETYSLHKPIRKKISRNYYDVTYIDETWQCDLNDMRSLMKFNEGYQYLLTVIDLFSKYAWALPLKSKKAEDVIQAFHVILKERQPLKVQSDKGTEFVNEKFKTYLKRKGIKFYTTNQPGVKAAVVERFNRTLKDRMYKYFSKYNTYNYVRVLPKLLQSYNNRVHSSIGMPPSKVNVSNAFQVAQKLAQTRGRLLRKRMGSTKAAFEVGDQVRISKERTPFAKGYTPNYSTEVFRIKAIVQGLKVPTYQLEDLNGEEIKGTFYREELVRVRLADNTEFQIDNILKRRGKGKKLEYFVKWKGYGDDFNSWIPASTVKRLQDVG